MGFPRLNREAMDRNNWGTRGDKTIKPSPAETGIQALIRRQNRHYYYRRSDGAIINKANNNGAKEALISTAKCRPTKRHQPGPNIMGGKDDIISAVSCFRV
ncbi:hypothetical protein Ddc_00903 [Ditylenchus destructor]|nr:hypothetical protein Ddc_00903 [Ditylenchus destructor]